MKLLIAFLIAIVLAVLMIQISPTQNSYPMPITRGSEVTYKIGEKVLANPYDTGWYSGTIKGIIGEDDYIVEVCGPFGWFHKHQCNTKELRRSVLAKQ